MRRWIWLFATIVLVLAVDQASKRFIMATLTYGETVQPIPVLAPYFQVTYTENRGAAFGFLSQASDIFLIIAFVVVIAH